MRSSQYDRGNSRKTKQWITGSVTLALLLTLGICHPAASAQAEGLLSSHREEIVDAIVQTHADIRSDMQEIHENIQEFHDNVQEFHSEVQAIREEVRAREAENVQPAEQPAEASSPTAQEPGTEEQPAATEPSDEKDSESTETPAADPVPDKRPLRSLLLNRLSEIDRQALREDAVEAVSQVKENLHKADEERQNLLEVAISDVQEELKDNPIHHDVNVNVDNSRFNRSITVERTAATQTPAPTQQPSQVYQPSHSTSPKTGDESHALAWAAMLGLSLMLCGATTVVLKKES